uniref:C-type lectin domain-containing protein n=1 Tax=Acrobeloides nanus TaxID=290746 RepID=A0A914DX49_9BILA
MRELFFYFLFFFCNIPFHLAVVNPPYGQLQVQGIYITNSSGIPIQLQGMSLYFSMWQPQYWNQDVLVSLQNQWNSNVVRAAMGLDRGGYIDNPESNYALTKAVIEGAINIGMYVIVDWHITSNLSYTPQAIAFFSNISKTYGSYPHIIYEIWNEPLATWDVIVNHANQVIPVIRANDPNNIIIVGTPNESSGPWFPPSQRLNYNNVMYTLHIYPDVFGGEGQEEARVKATTAMSNGIPIFVTEYGTGSVWPNETLEFGLAELWYKYFNQNFISHAAWSMSDIPEIFSAIKGDSTSSNTPAAQVGAIVANSAYFSADGIFVNQQYQNLGLTNSLSTFKVIPDSQYWLGLAIDKTKNPWNVTWADGSSNDYGNWVVPSLGTANGNCSGACATIIYSAYAQNPGLWTVVGQNSGYFPAICQMPARVYCPQDGLNWVYYALTNQCYRITTQSLNYQNAISQCKSSGGTLASIHFWNQNQFIMNLTSPSAQHVVNSSQYWIGQTINKAANPWNSTWQDGTATNYGNWNSPSQGPNNGDCTNQICAIIMYSATSTSGNPGTWDAVTQNSGNYPAICQINAIYEKKL